MTKRWLRWLPAALVPAVIAAGAVAANAATGAADLPEKTPKQVLALAAGTSVKHFSGTVTQSSELGLPSLPMSGPEADSSVSSVLDLVTGEHTARVYVDAPGKERVQVMDSLAERDLVRNGRTVWLYDSSTETATKLTLPEHAGSAAADAKGGVKTPADVAGAVLAHLDTSTDVTLGADTTVAGRAAYDLVLRPRSPATLVGDVSIAVDAATGLPLRVAVTARGADDPAIQVAFTKLSLAKPDADLFDFTPPAGTTVKKHSIPASHSAPIPKPFPSQKPTVIGSGWASIVELPAGAVPAKILSSPVAAQLTKEVSGGRALTTSLVSVLFTDDGRVLAGAVPLSALQAAAAR